MVSYSSITRQLRKPFSKNDSKRIFKKIDIVDKLSVEYIVWKNQIIHIKSVMGYGIFNIALH